MRAYLNRGAFDGGIRWGGNDLGLGIAGGDMSRMGDMFDLTYDLTKTYEDMLDKNPSKISYEYPKNYDHSLIINDNFAQLDNRVGTISNNHNDNSYKVTEQDGSYPEAHTWTRYDYVDPIISRSEYGGYGSESSYGYSLTKYVDCQSAIALLTSILFIDILRDVVESITMPNDAAAAAAGGGGGNEENVIVPRNKRRISLLHSPLELFIYDGGAEAVAEGLPDVIVPLLSDMSVAVHREESVRQHCISESLCKANSVLSNRYNGLGRVLGALISNVVASAFVGDQSELLQEALEASKWGRQGVACHVAYPCSDLLQNFTKG